MNLYQYLEKENFVDDMVNIVLSKISVPSSLYEDARQDVLVAWLGAKVDLSRSHSEILAYATTIGVRRVHQTMRDNLYPVKYPYSAFSDRLRGDNPRPSLGKSVNMEGLTEEVITELLDRNRAEDGGFEFSYDDIPGKVALTANQWAVIQMLSTGASMREIARSRGVSHQAISASVRDIAKKVQSARTRETA